MLQNMKGIVLNLRRQLPAVPGGQKGGYIQSHFTTKTKAKKTSRFSVTSKYSHFKLKVHHTQVLSMCPLIALHIQQRITIIDQASSVGTEGHILTLAVSGDEEAMSCRH